MVLDFKCRILIMYISITPHLHPMLNAPLSWAQEQLAGGLSTFKVL